MAESDYLGTGWGFPPKFTKNGKDLELVSGVDDVKQSLEIIFSTAINERLKYPDYGCDLKKFMFDAVDYSMVTELQQMLTEAVIKYEPRVEVQKIIVTAKEDNAHHLYVNIDYYIYETNTEENMVYPLYLY